VGTVALVAPTVGTVVFAARIVGRVALAAPPVGTVALAARPVGTVTFHWEYIGWTDDRCWNDSRLLSLRIRGYMDIGKSTE
jgi:hypothetical protein